MFCITGIFKCFTPHEDARRDATRHATPRRAGPPAIRFFILILFLSLFPNEPSSSFLAAFPFLPFFSSSIPLFCFLFSVIDRQPSKVRAPIAGLAWVPRGRNNYPRGKKKKKKGISISSIFDSIDALWGGIKFQTFEILFFSFYLSYSPFRVDSSNLSLHGFRILGFHSCKFRTIINFRSHEFFCSVASPLLLG